MLTPKDFTVYPYGSRLQKSEAETVACNIMVILSRTGNTWRKLPWEEYKSERMKDEKAGDRFTEQEKWYFDKVVGYTWSAEDAFPFSPAWAEVPKLKRK